MSFEYDMYLRQHKGNVAEAFYWIRDNIPEVLKDQNKYNYEHQICYAHDASKDEADEYKAYDAYFYGGNRSYAVVREFNYSWLRHLHRNPHHWQYWLLVNDDPDEGEVVMDMPYNFIVEMVCDWIFKFYEQHAGYMSLSDNTRREVEYILGKMKEKLSDESEVVDAK